MTHDGISLTIYQSKKNKNVILPSSLHPSVRILTNKKRTPETIQYYNLTKSGVDIVDQMARHLSVKASSRRWPVHTFYNILVLAAINAFVIYKAVTGEKLSRKVFLQKLSEELRLNYF
jgi:hypothetical protein